MLISLQAKADLKLLPAQQDTIAQKLMEGMVCQKDLKDCKDAFEKDGSCQPTSYLVGGVIGGAVLTFLVVSLAGGLK